LKIRLLFNSFDLEVLNLKEVAIALKDFIEGNNIEVLNVAVLRGSKDKRIYGNVFEIIDSVF